MGWFNKAAFKAGVRGTTSATSKAYKNVGASNTKKGGTSFKNLGGGGFFGKAFSAATRKRVSTVGKKRSGMLRGAIGSFVKKK
jgi:hypothetical protein